ncbi:MAG: TetR/AcrR family transcriptional regulator [Actinobacteria bacterium]|nr:TetR/AcrR family transcriptional regulator [Actinomycetota bacterium]
MTAVRPRTRARRGEGSKLREVILDTAERLLIEARDADAVSMRAIADAVGVTPPSIYLHYADKEALIRAVCERSFAAFDEVVERAGNTTDDPVESLRRRARAYVQFGLDNPEQYRILFMGKAAGVADPIDLSNMPGSLAFLHLVEAVERAIGAGLLRPGLEPFLVATGLWAAAHGMTSLLISLPEFPWPDVDTLVDHVCESMTYGLGRPDQRKQAQP